MIIAGGEGEGGGDGEGERRPIDLLTSPQVKIVVRGYAYVGQKRIENASGLEFNTLLGQQRQSCSAAVPRYCYTCTRMPKTRARKRGEAIISRAHI